MALSEKQNELLSLAVESVIWGGLILFIVHVVIGADGGPLLRAVGYIAVAAVIARQWWKYRTFERAG